MRVLGSLGRASTWPAGHWSEAKRSREAKLSVQGRFGIQKNPKPLNPKP